MSKRLRRPFLLLAAAALFLSACGSSDGEASSDETTSTEAASETTTTVPEPDCEVTEVEVNEAAPAPEPVEVDEDVIVDDLVEADADNCAIDSFGFNTIDLIGVTASGDEFANSWESGRAFSVQPGMLLPSLEEAMSDMVVGDVRTIALPPELAYGEDGDESIGVGPDEPVFFTVQLTAVTPSIAVCREPAPLRGGGENGKPEIVDLPIEPPTEVETEDLEPGEGLEAAMGDAVSVNYVGVSCTYGAEFDSSYDRGTPLEIDAIGEGLIEGFSEGLVGVRTGMVRLIRIPADLAYGEFPPGPGIAPSDPLVFHVVVESVTPTGGADDETGEDDPAQGDDPTDPDGAED